MSMLDRALELAARGLAVFPCRPFGKEPATKHGFHDATRDPQQIESWWRSRPDLNIGAATGAVSNIFVFDVDMKNGKDGERSLRELEARFGALPATVECKTPTGGRHVYFRHPGFAVKCTESQIGTGLDVKGDGGYVVCAPSIMANKRRYYWNGAAGKEIADAPGWLLDRLRAPSSTSVVKVTPTDEWRELVHNGVDVGQRNRSVARLAGHLMRRSVDPLFTLELLLAWDEARCRPPLGAREITTIVDSIAGKEMRRRRLST
jgi:hypothetical protein